MDFTRRFVRCLPVLLCCLLFAVPPARAGAEATCGDPQGGGPPPNATDALYILNVAVDLLPCNRCICDVDDSGAINTTDALVVLQVAVGQDIALNCPACDPEGLECPAVAQFALFATIRGACTTNADCAAFSACDTSIGRCRTGTDADAGWTGLSHNADTDDPVPARVFLDCEGPAPCGDCTITGHDPSLGNCRCASDNRQRCFTVAGPDEEFCGGGECICNFGPPLPLSAGNTPVCVLNTLAGQPEGVANVDEGSGSLVLHLKEKVFSGLSNIQPCPICINDTTPADGMRDGVCVGGINDTQSCDAQAYNSTFPPPTGALYSLDCFPLPDANIAGSGLSIETVLTTGRSELHADVPCASDGPGAGLKCPCRVCSIDPTVPCRSDADCAAKDAGTCTSNGLGQEPLPNACENLLCESIGNEQGQCTVGPDDNYCDQVLRANGTGLISCQTNTDCDVNNIGVVGGDCALVERRACFLDPIVTQGTPNPFVPFVGGTFCSPATSGASVNIVAGFPGPGRLSLQTAVSLFCKSAAQSQYTPGSGGCP